MALDTIVLSRAFDRDEDELRRAERVAKGIERALKGEVKIADLVDVKRPVKERPKTFHVPPEVSIDNSLSNRQTVIEISGLDRPGLLYDLTTALGKLNLNIASAHIVTFGEKAVDVFYVTDLTGTKVPMRDARPPSAGPSWKCSRWRKLRRPSAAALDLWRSGPDMWPDPFHTHLS